MFFTISYGERDITSSSLYNISIFQCHFICRSSQSWLTTQHEAYKLFLIQKVRQVSFKRMVENKKMNLDYIKIIHSLISHFIFMNVKSYIYNKNCNLSFRINNPVEAELAYIFRKSFFFFLLTNLRKIYKEIIFFISFWCLNTKKDLFLTLYINSN